jgi:hypothetical protein
MTKRNEIITSASAVLDKMFDRPLEKRIRDRAYELYVQGGRKDENAVEHWLSAEMELLGNR